MAKTRSSETQQTLRVFLCSTVSVTVMPWLFVVTNPSAQQTVREFALRVAREYTVGRQSPSRIKVLDRAVSRQQAVLTVKESATAGAIMELWIRDVSKFGVSLNGVRLAANVDTQLSDGDRVTLGANGSACRVHWQPLRIALSGASAALAARVDSLLRQLGAELVTAEFDFLVMDQVSTMSQKLLLALVAAVDVVRPEFLDQIVADARAAIDAEPPLPSPLDFAPVLTNADLKRWRDVDGVHLAPHADRRALFRRQLFYFFVQADFDILAAVIQRGGGHAVRFDAPPIAASLRQHIAANIASEDEASAVVFVVADNESAPTDVQLVAAERNAVLASRSALLQSLLTAKPISAVVTADVKPDPPQARVAIDVLMSRDAASHVQSSAALSTATIRAKRPVKRNTNDNVDDDDGDEDGWMSRSEVRTDRSEVAVARAAAVTSGGGGGQSGTDDAQLVVASSVKRFRKNAPTTTNASSVVGEFAEAREPARPELELFMRDRELEEKDDRRYAEQAQELFAAAAAQQMKLTSAAAKRKRN
jgi:hypothetical protein